MCIRDSSFPSEDIVSPEYSFCNIDYNLVYLAHDMLEFSATKFEDYFKLISGSIEACENNVAQMKHSK